MQTFLPYASFRESARCLDRKRLDNQRGEAKQILSALLTFPGDYVGQNQPAVQMWRGHERCLCGYGIAVCIEWQIRGHEDELLHWFREKNQKMQAILPVYPPWFGDERLHSSHRARLLAELPEHYNQFNWNETPSGGAEGFWWPTSQAGYAVL